MKIRILLVMMISAIGLMGPSMVTVYAAPAAGDEPGGLFADSSSGEAEDEDAKLMAQMFAAMNQGTPAPQPVVQPLVSPPPSPAPSETPEKTVDAPSVPQAQDAGTVASGGTPPDAPGLDDVDLSEEAIDKELADLFKDDEAESDVLKDVVQTPTPAPTPKPTPAPSVSVEKPAVQPPAPRAEVKTLRTQQDAPIESIEEESVEPAEKAQPQQAASGRRQASASMHRSQGPSRDARARRTTGRRSLSAEDRKARQQAAIDQRKKRSSVRVAEAAKRVDQRKQARPGQQRRGLVTSRPTRTTRSATPRRAGGAAIRRQKAPAARMTREQRKDANQKRLAQSAQKRTGRGAAVREKHAQKNVGAAPSMPMAKQSVAQQPVAAPVQSGTPSVGGDDIGEELGDDVSLE